MQIRMHTHASSETNTHTSFCTISTTKLLFISYTLTLRDKHTHNSNINAFKLWHKHLSRFISVSYHSYLLNFVANQFKAVPNIIHILDRPRSPDSDCSLIYYIWVCFGVVVLWIYVLIFFANQFTASFNLKNRWIFSKRYIYWNFVSGFSLHLLFWLLK